MVDKSFSEITKCRICHSSKLIDVIDLGDQPIPNGFIRKEDLNKKESRYPLVAVFCSNCSLMQLKHIVEPKVMFENYLYIPSASNTRIDYFKKMAKQVKKVGGLRKNDLVVDIGSNDGSLLNCFKNIGMNILGVDPAENLAKIAVLNGIPMQVGYFDSRLAKNIVKKYGKAKAITATNVIAHIHNLHEVLKGGDELLEDEGIFVMHFPYSYDLIKNNLFDTIYHEHLSYFSVKSLMKLAEESNLEIFKIIKSDLDGGSIRVFWKKKINKNIKIDKDNIEDFIKKEKDYGLHEERLYREFEKRIKHLKLDTNKKLLKIKTKNKKIVGYGAAAKANVLLNYFEINTSMIDYIVDSTPYKQQLFTPGTHIPIYAEDKIKETKPDFVLIFAWNFSKEIMEKNKNYNGKYIVLEPKFRIL